VGSGHKDLCSARSPDRRRAVGKVSRLPNIERQILDPGDYLYLEPQFLLREELREPRNYFAILQAIAQGRTRLNEIAQVTGLGRQPISRLRSHPVYAIIRMLLYAYIRIHKNT